MATLAAKLALVNGLTGLRLILALAYPWLPHDTRFAAIAIASLTEFLDGFLARRLQATSLFGQLFDPIADKVFVGMVAITYWLEAKITFIEVIGFFARDITALAFSWAAYLKLHEAALSKLKPKMLGKLATGFQLIALLSLALELHFAALLFRVAIFWSVLSAMDYTYTALSAKTDQ